jgi:hypothetical protein
VPQASPPSQQPAAAPAQLPVPPPPRGSLAAQRRAAHAAQIAANRAAHQQASQARRAAEAAAAEQAAQAAWLRTGKPARLIVVRPRVIDTITAGHLTSRLARAGGPLSLLDVAAYVPSDWLTISRDTAVLSATLALTADSTLDAGVATLRLSGDSDPASAASIWVGRGTLTLNNVLVTSWYSASQQPMPVSAPGRPFLVVGSGGQLNASGTTLSDLGATGGPPAGGDRAGVVFAPGSSGSLLRTRLVRNLVGLKLSRSNRVHLEGVTVDDSGNDGLILHEDQGTNLQTVNVTNSGGNGVLVTGVAGGRVLSGVSTSGNGAFGVAVIRQNHVQVMDTATSANRAGGLRLTGCTACTITRTTVANEPIGLLVNGGGSQVAVDHAQMRSVGRGVVLTHGVTEIDIHDLSVDDAGTIGVAVAATGVRLRGINVRNSTTGVQVNSLASQVAVADPTIVGGGNGIVVADGARGVTLKNVTIGGVDHTAVVVSAPDVLITGGRIHGGNTGINLRAPARIDGTSVSEVREGVHVARGVTGRGSRIDVLATNSGIKVDGDGQFILTNSRVRANQALRGRVVLKGDNTISLPPFPWFGGIGVLLIAAAVSLELLHIVLQRRRGPTLPRRAPAGVVGRRAPAFLGDGGDDR